MLRSPLRAARAEQAAALIRGYPDGMVLTEELYRSVRHFDGLTRQQLDAAIDDLVATDRAELVNSGAVLVVRLVREGSE